MKTIALLVTHGYYPSRPDRTEPDYASDQLALMQRALTPHSIAIEPVFWQDEGQDWSRYDAVMPLLAWNYPQQVDVFLRRLAEIEAAGALLLNSADVVLANMDKSYLADLGAKGAPVPPTLNVEAVSPDIITSCFDRFDCDEIIIKPRIGAGAWRQARMKRTDSVPSADVLPPGPALIQPFLEGVTHEGELSLLYFGGDFSHAVMKTPKAGDYRTQGQHGAVEIGTTAPQDALTAAREILATALVSPITYARVDLVRGSKGEWLLMELELIEPWLYLALDGHSGTHGAALLANAIVERLNAPSP